jgi:hypothetical protein
MIFVSIFMNSITNIGHDVDQGRFSIICLLSVCFIAEDL